MQLTSLCAFPAAHAREARFQKYLFWDRSVIAHILCQCSMGTGTASLSTRKALYLETRIRSFFIFAITVDNYCDVRNAAVVVDGGIWPGVRDTDTVRSPVYRGLHTIVHST